MKLTRLQLQNIIKAEVKRILGGNLNDLLSFNYKDFDLNSQIGLQDLIKHIKNEIKNVDNMIKISKDIGKPYDTLKFLKSSYLDDIKYIELNIKNKTLNN